MPKFELQISWMMTTTVEVEAGTEEDATRFVLAGGTRMTDGSFVPFSMTVDRVAMVRIPATLLRVK